MDGLAEIPKLKPYHRSRLTDQDPQMAAFEFSHNAGPDQFQPLMCAGDGVRTSENHFKSAETHYPCEDGKPPSLTSLNQPVLHRHVQEDLRSSGGDRDCTRSETVPSGSQQPGVAVEVPLQFTEGLDSPQIFRGRRLPRHEDVVNQGPVHFTLKSASLGGGGEGDPVTSSSTIQLPKEALLQLQSCQGKNGHIKRPMNAFLVWSSIRRCVLRGQNPGARVTNTSAELGLEWSKLSVEEKRPYFEIANKLKYMHQQRFPDYEYRPQRKKSRRYLLPGQSLGQDVNPSACRPITPSCSEFQGPNGDAWLSTIPYTVGVCGCPCYHYIPIDFCSSAEIQCASRIFNESSNTYSTMKKEGNYHHSHPQTKESDPAPLYDTKQQDYYVASNSHEVRLDFTITSDSLEPTDSSISQQLSANDTLSSRCGDYVDVVGLL